MTEEELAQELIFAKISSPRNDGKYSSSICFFDNCSIPTQSNTPIDEMNESIELMFPIMQKTDSME